MTPINILTSTAAPLPLPNIDTDQIIPKQFLKRIERTGYGDFLFFDWRRIQEGPNAGSEDPNFVLNRPEYRRRRDPHRRTQLRLRLLPRARRLGHQPVRLPRRHRPHLRRHLLLERRQKRHHPRPPHRGRSRDPPRPLHRQPAAPDHHQPRPTRPSPTTVGFHAHFDIDPFRKDCLLNGLDDIGLTLRHEADLDRYEQHHNTEFWLAPAQPRSARPPVQPHVSLHPSRFAVILNAVRIPRSPCPRLLPPTAPARGIAALHWPCPAP